MSVFDWFRGGRSKGADTKYKRDLPRVQAEGGQSVFSGALSKYRQAAVSESVNLVRSDPDPTQWPHGQMAFELETSLAHGHEGLRDRLSSFIASRLAHEVQRLYDLAGRIALARDALRRVDNDLVRTTHDWVSLYQHVKKNKPELGRYHRRRSRLVQVFKWIIAGVFIATELILTGNVFESVFGTEFPLGGFLLAAGVLVLFVAVPHYAALGIKEGMIQYHAFERRDLQEKKQHVPADLNRMQHEEEQEDRGYRYAASLTVVFLLAAMVPLAVIRSNDLGGEGISRAWWFAFFFALQVAISSYFFLREWRDHGNESANLYRLARDRDRLANRRQRILNRYGKLVARFHKEAEKVLFTAQEAPRWDSHVVETYLETLHYVRHIMGVERQDIAQFIHGAVIPYLGTAEEARSSQKPLDPTSAEHLALEDEGPRGRAWRIRQLTDRWIVQEAKPSDGSEDDLEATESSDSWLIRKSPTELLDVFLKRYFDLRPYERQREIDLTEVDTGELERVAAILGIDEPSEALAGVSADDASVVLLAGNMGDKSESSADERSAGSSEGSETDRERRAQGPAKPAKETGSD